MQMSSAFMRRCMCCTVMLLSLFLFVSCDNEMEEENKVEIGGETYTEVRLTLLKAKGTPFDGNVLPENYPLQFFLMREDTKEVFSYVTEVTYEDKKVNCSMFVPETAPIADGRYWLLMISHTEAKRYPFQLELVFKDHVCVAGEYKEFYTAFEGEGTQTNPYRINSYKDLLVLHTDIEMDLTRAAGKYFRQRRDIDLNDYYKDPDRVEEQGWSGIANGFSGIYDGNGTVIYNLVSEATHDNVGFFHSLGDGAVVKDVSFRSVSINTPTGNNVGVVAGSATGNVRLEGINVAGSLFASQNVGGFIGSVDGTVSVENSSNEGLYLKSTGGNVGGFIGYAKVVDIREVTLCARIESEGDRTGGVAGSVSGIGSSMSDIDNTSAMSITGANATGGLVGSMNGSYSIRNVVLEKTATSSTSTNAINGSGNTGGLIGETSPTNTSSISSCRVQLRLKGEDNTGGFVGKVTKGASVLQIVNCSSGTKGNIEGRNNVGGVVGLSESDMQIRNEKFDDKVSYRLPVVGGGRCTGGVAGQSAGMTLTNIIAGANVTGNDVVGGFFGEADAPQLIKCCTDPTIHIQGRKNVGGVAGSVYAPSIQTGSDFSALINPDERYACEAMIVGGLFGYARSARVDGVVVRSKVRGTNIVGGLIGQADEKVTIVNSTNYSTIDAANDIGGLVGQSVGESLSIDACHNYGAVKGHERVGGIVGHTHSAYTLKNARNRANVTATGDMAGGICGYAYSKAKIESCSNTGNVSARNKAGGIVGTTDTDANKEQELKIIYCANKGEISVDDKSVGGLIGFVYGHFSVEQSYNNGVHSGNENIGGIVGEISGYYTLNLGFQYIRDCYNSGSSSGSKHRAGIVGYKGADAGISSLQVNYCYNSANTGWGIFGGVSNTASYDYGNVYYIDSNSGDFSQKAKKCSLNELKNLRFGSLWTTGSDGLPKLVNAATFD